MIAPQYLLPQSARVRLSPPLGIGRPMTEDDRAYARSVRNMSIILAGIVLAVFAAIFVPPLFAPSHVPFSTSSTIPSPYGFDLGVRINATQLGPNQYLEISAWVNNTSSQILNVTAGSNWPLDENGLWGKLCTSGWPIGIGVMRGFYTNYNYTLGTLVPLPRPLVSCPVSSATPQYFLIERYSSEAIASVNGTLERWDLQSNLVFGSTAFGHDRLEGVYTVVAADEWGDVAFLYFTTNYVP